jgi:hypothetical protein
MDYPVALQTRIYSSRSASGGAQIVHLRVGGCQLDGRIFALPDVKYLKKYIDPFFDDEHLLLFLPSQ